MKEISKEEAEYLRSRFPLKMIPKFDFIYKTSFNPGRPPERSIECNVNFYFLRNPGE